MQLFVQTVPRHASWLLVGPPAATSLAPQQDITVTFSGGSSVVVPAGVPAALLGGGTTWDRTSTVVVGYVLLGSGTLLACPEAQLGTISTDYAPLVRVLADSVQVYQPQQPSTLGALVAVQAYNSVNLTISSSGTHPVTLDTTSYDYGGTGSHHNTTTNTERVYFPEDGTYLVEGVVEWDGDTSGTIRKVQLQDEGSLMMDIDNRPPVGFGHLSHVHWVGPRSAGGYVWMYASHNATGTRTLSADDGPTPRLSVTRIA